MDKVTYARLFQEAIQRALELPNLSSVDTEPAVKFVGRPNPPAPITVDEALDLLWLSPEQFYLVVDVMAFVGEDNPPVLFVRPSGHPPDAYSETWDPSDLGPFRGIGPISPSDTGRPALDG